MTATVCTWLIGAGLALADPHLELTATPTPMALLALTIAAIQIVTLLIWHS
jgi:hypothetical protein